MKRNLPNGDLPSLTGDGRDGFTTRAQLEWAVQCYIDELSAKKKGKALVDKILYDRIFDVALAPHNYSLGDAQFRWWVRKSFALVQDQTKKTTYLAHENRPVVIREQIYDVLIQAHAACDHGGRDKTSAEVRAKFSWIPKEITSRFVSLCPGCDAWDRRDQRYFGGKLNGYYPVNDELRRMAIESGHATEASYSEIDPYQPPLPPGMRHTPKKRVRKTDKANCSSDLGPDVGVDDAEEPETNNGGKVATSSRRTTAAARRAAAPYIPKKTSNLPPGYTHHPLAYGRPSADVAYAPAVEDVRPSPPSFRLRLRQPTGMTPPSPGHVGESGYDAAMATAYVGQPGRASVVVQPSPSPIQPLFPDGITERPTPGYAAVVVDPNSHTPIQPHFNGIAERPTPGFSAGVPESVNDHGMHGMPRPGYGSLGLPTPYSTSFNGMPLPSTTFTDPSTGQTFHPDFTGLYNGDAGSLVDANVGHCGLPAQTSAPAPVQPVVVELDDQPLAKPYLGPTGEVATTEKDLFDMLILGRKQPPPVVGLVEAYHQQQQQHHQQQQQVVVEQGRGRGAVVTSLGLVMGSGQQQGGYHSEPTPVQQQPAPAPVGGSPEFDEIAKWFDGSTDVTSFGCSSDASSFDWLKHPSDFFAQGVTSTPTTGINNGHQASGLPAAAPASSPLAPNMVPELSFGSSTSNDTQPSSFLFDFEFAMSSVSSSSGSTSLVQTGVGHPAAVETSTPQDKVCDLWKINTTPDIGQLLGNAFPGQPHDYEHPEDSIALLRQIQTSVDTAL